MRRATVIAFLLGITAGCAAETTTSATEDGTDAASDQGGGTGSPLPDAGASEAPECATIADCSGLVGCASCVCLMGHCAPPPPGPCTSTACEGVAGRNACAADLSPVCSGCTTGSGCIPEAACTAYGLSCTVTPVTPPTAPADSEDGPPPDAPPSSSATSDAG